jgi:hypothetical protein
LSSLWSPPPLSLHHFHRPLDEPLHFLPRADRCATSIGPLSGILGGASSLRPLLPPPPPMPPPTMTSEASTPRGTFHRAAAYAATFSSTIQPTNQPTKFALCETDFSVTVIKFSTPNFPLTKKKCSCVNGRNAFLHRKKSFRKNQSKTSQGGGGNSKCVN